MKVLLDTCVIIWAISQPDKLSVTARSMLGNSDTEVSYSPVSCAEVACAQERKRIRIDRHWKLWFRHYVEMNRWQELPVDLPIIEEAYSLPGAFHSDPMDRILVASCRQHHLSLITADRKIIDYPHVETVW